MHGVYQPGGYHNSGKRGNNRQRSLCQLQKADRYHAGSYADEFALEYKYSFSAI